MHRHASLFVATGTRLADWWRSQAGRAIALGLAAMLSFATTLPAADDGFSQTFFRRIATFPVFLNTCNGQLDDNDCLNRTTVAEIITASEDGKLLIYTDSATENIGFVDITNPANPQPAGLIDVGGEPTSVAVAGEYALAVVNTSESFVNPSGQLIIIQIPSRTVEHSIELGGQPDSIAVSPDRRYAAIVIENERNEETCAGGDLDGQEVDEDECEAGGGVLGGLPQLPAGFLVIVDLMGEPQNWTTRQVPLTGLADKFPEDPEPELVDINTFNVAAVTLQENNHIVLVHLPSGNIVQDFSAGEVTLGRIDTEENALIELQGALSGIPREPDAVAWLSPLQLATADEGDLVGGSRGFSIFRANGHLNFTSRNALEHVVVRLGHYPEDRSENQGNEPEGIEYGQYGSERLLFVGAERSSVVFVYELPLSVRRSTDHGARFFDPISRPPRLLQVLPGGVGPEGLLAIPKRHLFVTASEEDAREDTVRAAITIYELQHGKPTYPTILSANRRNGLPIPWGALSGLAGDPYAPDKAYAVYDNFYRASRIFVIDVQHEPAVITDEIVLKDGDGNTLDLDLEGIATRATDTWSPSNQKLKPSFWVVSEGGGNAPNPESLNLLLEIDARGNVLQEIQLPESVNALQRSNGFEGVAAVGSGETEFVYVAFQREWERDPLGFVRIGRYQVASGAWTFFYYPLDRLDDSPTLPSGAWVGLSEIVAVDAETFAVVERDNQAGPDATIKKIYKFSVSGLTPQPQGGDFPEVTKMFVRDLIPDLSADHGLVIEKVEGLTILLNGNTLIVTDNDGVDGSSGETQFINLGRIFD
jgi:Esterase-like activity of phytase